MQTNRDTARIRATYTDLFDHEESEDLAPFIGQLEAAYAPPALPTKVQAALEHPTWEAVGLPPNLHNRPHWHHRLPFWPPRIETSETIVVPPQSPPRRWTQ